MTPRTFDVLWYLTLVVALVLACLMAARMIDFVLGVL